MKKLLFTFLSVPISSLIILQGCSLIGLAVGVTTDKSKKTYAESYSELLLLENDKMCRITLKSGEIDSAKFIETDQLSEEGYKTRYSKSRKELQDSLALPELGEVLTISRGEIRKQVEFKGFDANYVLIEVNDQSEPLQLSYPWLRLSFIQDSQNNIMEFSKLEEYIQQRKIALLSTMSFQTKEDIQKIPLDEIVRVDFEVNKYGALIGFFAGAIVDACLIHAFLKWSEDFPLGELGSNK